MNENRDLNQRENGINPSELSGKGDYYFSNGVQERTPRTTPVGTKRKPAKKGNGVKSTYVFFIVVIVVSMALSVYAVFCMNDILSHTSFSVSLLTISGTVIPSGKIRVTVSEVAEEPCKVWSIPSRPIFPFK